MPPLVRSETRSVAAGFLRRGEKLPSVLTALAHARRASVEVEVSDQAVMQVVSESTLSAYDAEFVALARALACSLVTTDKQVLDQYPGLAVRLSDFVR